MTTRVVASKKLRPILDRLLVAAYTDPEGVKEWRRMKLAELEEKSGRDEKARSALEARGRDIQRRKKRLLAAVEDGALSHGLVRERSAELEDEATRYRDELAKINTEYAALKRKLDDDFEVMLTAFERMGRFGANEDRLLIRGLIEKATFGNDRLVIEWKNGIRHDLSIRKLPKWLEDSVEVNESEYLLDHLTESANFGRRVPKG